MKALSIVLGILLLIGGIVCLATPAMTAASLPWIAACAMLFFGIAAIVKYCTGRNEGVSIWALVGGILSSIFALMLMGNGFMQFLTDAFFAYLLGIWMLIIGITKIVEAAKLSKVQDSMWGLPLTLGILTTLLGAYAFFHPVFSFVTIGVLIGIYVLMAGIDMIMIGSIIPSGKE